MVRHFNLHTVQESSRPLVPPAQFEIVRLWVVAEFSINHSDVDFSQEVGNFAGVSPGAPPPNQAMRPSHVTLTLGVGFYTVSSLWEVKGPHSFGYSCLTIQLKAQSCLRSHGEGRGRSTT